MAYNPNPAGGPSRTLQDRSSVSRIDIDDERAMAIRTDQKEPIGASSAAAEAVADRQPIVWLIGGYRAGERTQMLALAEALGWPFEIKELVYRPYDAIPGLLRIDSLAGIDRDASSPLRPPWPDLVISAGMRNEPVCRWIRKRSGGRTRLVHIGRPWAAYRNFDLVVTTPQYRLPQRNNILQNTGTLHRVCPETLTAAAALRSSFAHLPEPYVGVIIGGNSGPYTFGPNTARDLAREASDMARTLGGSLLVSTSARTIPAATDALAGTIDCPHYLYRWTPADRANPYFTILALASALIVTSDSVSMLSEAAATGAPLYIFDLDPEHRQPPAGADSVGRDFRLTATLYSLLMRFGHKRLTRDLELFHRRLVDSGRAAWLGDEGIRHGAVEPLPDVQRAVARVRALLAA
jgi:mitochondrial fission protein ELM1